MNSSLRAGWHGADQRLNGNPLGPDAGYTAEYGLSLMQTVPAHIGKRLIEHNWVASEATIL